MKEATGELNMTVVTVVAIAAVAAFFYAFVWPSIKNSIESSTNCTNAICDPANCTETNGTRVCTNCSWTDKDGNEVTEKTCRYNSATGNNQ